MFFGNIPPIEDTSQQYTSLNYRLQHWNHARENFLINGPTIIFGSGAEFIYYDSLIFRILFTTGVIGTIFFIILMIKIPFYLIVFFLLSGLTIDFVASYKLSVTVIQHTLHFVIAKRINYANGIDASNINDGGGITLISNYSFDFKAQNVLGSLYGVIKNL